MQFHQETFFRPEEVYRERVTLPATLYNQSRLLLARSTVECAFVPLRSMQFQAVITRAEIIFVDSHGGYAVRDGKGGRIILIAWEPDLSIPRDSLTVPAPIDVIHYRAGLRETQRRLVGEFGRAVDEALRRQRPERSVGQGRAEVLPLRERERT